jgi:hypothetical protein
MVVLKRKKYNFETSNFKHQVFISRVQYCVIVGTIWSFFGEKKSDQTHCQEWVTAAIFTVAFLSQRAFNESGRTLSTLSDSHDFLEPSHWFDEEKLFKSRVTRSRLKKWSYFEKIAHYWASNWIFLSRIIVFWKFSFRKARCNFFPKWRNFFHSGHSVQK